MTTEVVIVGSGLVSGALGVIVMAAGGDVAVAIPISVVISIAGGAYAIARCLQRIEDRLDNVEDRIGSLPCVRGRPPRHCKERRET